jgi:hypothetical protein
MQSRNVLVTLALIVFLAAGFVIGPKLAPKATQAADGPVLMQAVTPAEKTMYLEKLPKDFELPLVTDYTGQLLLREYGALFVARNGVTPPKKVIFQDEKDVQAFQASVETDSEIFGAITIELQKEAMEDLRKAMKQAVKQGVSISPRGADSGRRSYTMTEKLWASRVIPGMKYWVAKGRVTPKEAARIQALAPFEQVPEILNLEKQGIYFAKDLSKSIIYSVAPPGTSQHLSMLALDVAEFDNPLVRAILAKYNWYQTVTSDLPHFTYLGVEESKLPGIGLKKVINAGRSFWVPDL